MVKVMAVKILNVVNDEFDLQESTQAKHITIMLILSNLDTRPRNNIPLS